jgi:hypothetical protein
MREALGLQPETQIDQAQAPIRREIILTGEDLTPRNVGISRDTSHEQMHSIIKEESDYTSKVRLP